MPAAASTSTAAPVGGSQPSCPAASSSVTATRAAAGPDPSGTTSVALGLRPPGGVAGDLAEGVGDVVGEVEHRHVRRPVGRDHPGVVAEHAREQRLVRAPSTGSARPRPPAPRSLAGRRGADHQHAVDPVVGEQGAQGPLEVVGPGLEAQVDGAGPQPGAAAGSPTTSRTPGPARRAPGRHRRRRRRPGPATRRRCRPAPPGRRPAAAGRPAPGHVELLGQGVDPDDARLLQQGLHRRRARRRRPRVGPGRARALHRHDRLGAGQLRAIRLNLRVLPNDSR